MVSGANAPVGRELAAVTSTGSGRGKARRGGRPHGREVRGSLPRLGEGEAPPGSRAKKERRLLVLSHLRKGWASSGLLGLPSRPAIPSVTITGFDLGRRSFSTVHFE